MQHAQQLDLDGQRQVADFVKEQGASIGGFEPADLGGEGSGEGAFFMTEEFAFHQVFRERAAVDGDERCAFAAAEFVHVARDKFLAGAGLADDEHVGFAGCDHADAFEQGERLGVFKHLRGGAYRCGVLARLGQGEQGR
ncbi:hypothetical protein SDC9_91686 [bioreactor metagenome]|uniref:Uncharacterized protein n=1 Tax=bioreactor metagenome TaxID=1076179 RepID=A0A644ZYH6_9ZZZZ